MDEVAPSWGDRQKLWFTPSHSPAALVAKGINISAYLCPLLNNVWENFALQNERAYKLSTTFRKQLKVHPFTVMSQWKSTTLLQH